ncbi:MAG: phosphoglycerate mutase family protein [Bacteroidetes bacterium]|nr:phosphoglycerate mutase family protein [Bacteroidota bacterium]
MRFIPVLVIMLLLSSCGTTIYVVRHAEKATGIDPETMQTIKDPPLTYEGQERALALKQMLSGKNIKHIYSTNTLRTISTAKPLKELFLKVPLQLYSSKPDSMDMFIQQLKAIRKGNTLVVGHSNTVDDIANKICGTKVVAADLKDSEYDNIFILKRKGNTFKFKGEKYGKPSVEVSSK